MEEQVEARIGELINVVTAGKYVESQSFDDPHGTYRYKFTFPSIKRREAVRELERIAKHSPKEVKLRVYAGIKGAEKFVGFPLSRSSRVLGYLKVGLVGLAIGMGAGKGCERYVYHQKVEEVRQKHGGYSEKLRKYTQIEVEFFKRKYQEKQFSKNLSYMGVGGLVALVVPLLIAKSIWSFENTLNVGRQKNGRRKYSNKRY